MFELLYMLKTRKVSQAMTVLVAAVDWFDAIYYVRRSLSFEEAKYFRVLAVNRVPEGEVWQIN